MKNKILFLVAVMALSLFVSCGPKDTNELVINSYMSDEAPKKAFQAIVDDFKKQNPEIKVVVNITAHEQFKTQLPNWLTSKNAPDVVTWFAGYRMQQFAEKGLLLPIGDVFPDSEFPKAFKNASSYNGKVYFMPQSWYWWAVYYNKDVFKKVGVSVPKTWEEFLVVCEKLKAAGIAPISIGAKDTWTAGGWFDYMNSAVNGGEFHQKLTAGEVSYTDPKVQKTFSFIAELSKKGYFIKNAASYSWQEATKPLFAGKAGMYLMGQFLHDVAPEDKKASIDFFKFPIVGDVTEYSVDTPTDGYMVPANAKNVKNAKKFMAFLATKEVQEKFCTPLGRLAANKNVPAPNAQAEKGLKMVEGATYAMQFYDRDAPSEMATKGMNAIVDVMVDPKKVDAVLESLEADRKRVYEK